MQTVATRRRSAFDRGNGLAENSEQIPMTPRMLVPLVCLLFWCEFAQADSLQVWHPRNPLPTDQNLNGSAFGNGRFVGVGDRGTIVTSSNGVDWAVSETGTNADFLTVAFGNGRFVIGGRLVTLWSDDGLHWTNGVMPRPGADVNAIGFGIGTNFPNGRFVSWVITNDSSGLSRSWPLYSSNGVDWATDTSSQASINSPITSIAFGADTFVVSQVYQGTSPFPSGSSFYSKTGNSWFLISFNGDGYGAVASGNGRFIRAGGFTTISNGFSVSAVISTNGTAWPAAAGGETFYARAATFGGAGYVVVGVGGCVGVSMDATNWIVSRIATNINLLTVSYGNGTYVVMGQSGFIATSTDGVSWVQRSRGVTADLYAVAPADDGFMAVGANGTILHSTNGVGWDQLSSPTSNSLRAALQANGRFVLAGDNGTILSGMALTNLAVQSSGVTQSILGITFGAGKFVAVGSAGLVLSSPDSILWSIESSGTTQSLDAAAFGNAQFVAGGNGGTLISSVDGQTWVPQVSGLSRWFSSIIYAKGRFVAAGQRSGGNILEPFMATSQDGVNWSPVLIGPPRFLPNPAVALASDGKLFLSSGGLEFHRVNVVTSAVFNVSSDGVNWVRIPVTTNWPVASLLTYNNGTFVAASVRGRISQSDPVVQVEVNHLGLAQLNIIGPKNGVYRIEGLDSLATTNEWQSLTVLSNAPYVWVDPQSASATNRVYRAVLLH